MATNNVFSRYDRQRWTGDVSEMRQVELILPQWAVLEAQSLKVKLDNSDLIIGIISAVLIAVWIGIR
jgi:hypothetical protein